MIIPDWEKTINEGAIEALGKPRNIWFFNQLEGVSEVLGFDYDTKLSDLNSKQLDILLNGSKEKIAFKYKYGGGKSVVYKHKFSGVVNYIKHYYDNTSSNKIRDWEESFMNTLTC